MPLDLVIIMLGTNDLWADKDRTPLEIGLAAMELVARVKGSAGAAGTSYPAPDVLLIAPPPLAPSAREDSLADYLRERIEASKQFSEVYSRLATAVGVAFLDAGDVVTVGGVDGVHFSEDNHRALGQAVARHVEKILSEEMLPAAE